MDSFKQLDIWEKVNACETLEELSDIILSLADDNGMIKGRTRKFYAKEMSDACLDYEKRQKSCLTREFGIRQQALYILFYTERL